MTDKEQQETITMINDFETYINKTTHKGGNKCFDEKEKYGRIGEVAAMNILQHNYNNDTFIDVAKLNKSYDILWYNKGNLIGSIDIKRSTSMNKYGTCIFELTDRTNYEQKGWWYTLTEEHITYIGFITDDLKTLHLIKINDIAKHIDFHNYEHKCQGNWLSYVPLKQLQQLESYICLQAGEDND